MEDIPFQLPLHIKAQGTLEEWKNGHPCKILYLAEYHRKTVENNLQTQD
jgi:hypothetical protein